MSNFEEWRKNSEGRIAIVSTFKDHKTGDVIVRLSRNPEQKKNLVTHKLTIEEYKHYTNGTLQSFLNGGQPYKYEHYWEDKNKKEEEARRAELDRCQYIKDNAKEFDDIEVEDTVYDLQFNEIGEVLDVFCAKFNKFIILNKTDEYGDNIMVRFSRVYVV